MMTESIRSPSSATIASLSAQHRWEIFVSFVSVLLLLCLFESISLPLLPHLVHLSSFLFLHAPQGASATFQPLSGLLAGRQGPEALLRAAARAASLLDKATVTLYLRPIARVLLLLYLITLHVGILILL